MSLDAFRVGVLGASDLLQVNCGVFVLLASTVTS